MDRFQATAPSFGSVKSPECTGEERSMNEVTRLPPTMVAAQAKIIPPPIFICDEKPS
jgi:hypothetical protein